MPESDTLLKFAEDIIVDANEIIAIHTPQNKSKEWHTVELKNGTSFDIHHNVYKSLQNYLQKTEKLKEIVNE